MKGTIVINPIKNSKVDLILKLQPFLQEKLQHIKLQ